MKVTLTKEELWLGATCGVARVIESADFSKDVHAPGGRGIDWERDIEGSLAEMATAKHINRYWAGAWNTFKGADVSTDIQVRHTTRNSGSLIVRPNDDMEHYYFLVTGTMPTYTIQGWMQGVEAAVQRYLSNPNGRGKCWMVPQEELKPFEKREGK